MTIQTTQFVRKPFVIEAVEVTAENINEVAEWCSGEVRGGTVVGGEEKHVKVKVQHPLNERQTKAFVRDWVLKAGAGFKVYTPKAFANSFDRLNLNADPKDKTLDARVSI